MNVDHPCDAMEGAMDVDDAAVVEQDMTEADLVVEFLQRIVDNQCRYIGIYSPGDYGEPTYRVVVPAPGNGRGRGFRAVREEVVLETDVRADIDNLVQSVAGLVSGTSSPINHATMLLALTGQAGLDGGPLAVRHILNPSTALDEGVRIIWARDGPAARAEMGDWPRRDAMMRDGKTVRAPDDGGGGGIAVGPLGQLVLNGAMLDAWAEQQAAAAAAGGGGLDAFHARLDDFPRLTPACRLRDELDIDLPSPAQSDSYEPGLAPLALSQLV